MPDFIISLRDDIGNRNFSVTVRDVLDKHEAMRIAADQTARDHDMTAVQLRVNGCQPVDEHETPVLFRIKRGKQYANDGVTAVFPCEPADYEGDVMTCYAHVGQHSGASFGWYNETGAATEAEYADLKRELESAPYGYRLKVYKRMTRGHRAAFKAELKRLRGRATT